MKLLCVNSKIIIINDLHHRGENLKEGNIYITRGKVYKDHKNRSCYYIEGIGERLACRFTELLDDKSEEKSIEEQIEEAISKEDYELAEILKSKLK